MPPCPAGEVAVAIAAPITVAVGEALAPGLALAHTLAVAALRLLLVQFAALAQPLLALFGARLARFVAPRTLFLAQLIATAVAILRIPPVFILQPRAQFLPFLPLLCAQRLAPRAIQILVFQLPALACLQVTQLIAIALALLYPDPLLLALADRFASLYPLHARPAIAPGFAALTSAAAKCLLPAVTASKGLPATATAAASEGFAASATAASEGFAATATAASEGLAASAATTLERLTASAASASEGLTSSSSASEGFTTSTSASASECFAASTPAASERLATTASAALSATLSATIPFAGGKISRYCGSSRGVLLRVCRKSQQQHKCDWHKCDRHKSANHRSRPDCTNRPYS